MSYFLVAAGFALFTVVAAAVTLVSWVYRPLRAVFPFTWRAWVGGTVGFMIANALLIGAVVLFLKVGESTAVRSNMVGGIAAVTLLIGPFVASAVGILLGVILGCYFGWRSSSHTGPSSLNTSLERTREG